MSFSVILPFLRPIEHLILNEAVSEVMVNPSGRIFVEKDGVLSEIQGAKLEEKHLEIAVKNIARQLGDDISEERPILDSRLPDGSRVAAVLAPCSVGGTTLTIRKFQRRYFSLGELVQLGTVADELARLLLLAVHDRKNILISGGTGTGKTTLLTALANWIPDKERIIVIEDTAETQIEKPNLIRFESRSPRPGLLPITVRDFVKASLRHRPDRLIVGEVRGEEAFDLLQALNTGHAGSLSTIHANSAAHALVRLTNCVLTSGVALPHWAIRANIAASIDLIAHVQRRGARRLVTELVAIRSYLPSIDNFDLEPLYQFVEVV